MRLSIHKHLKYFFEAAALYALAAFMMFLPPERASDFGGWLGRHIGLRLGITRRARKNLERVLPDLSERDREKVILEMWDNLGRTTAEYPHLEAIWASGFVEVSGLEQIAALAQDGKPGFLVAGHIANWEIAPAGAGRHGLPVWLVYRHLNNPYADSLLKKLRGRTAAGSIPKGPAGARQILKVLKQGGHIAMLVDQKMNDGISVPFFGIPAMTAPAVAEMALRFGCPVVPARTERLKGCRFRVTVLPPLSFPETGTREEKVYAMMETLNQTLETWIRACPGQWLWIHSRWPREA